MKPASANHALSNQNFEILSGMFPMRSFHARPWTTEKSTYSCSVGQLTTCRVRLESSKSKKTGGRLQKQTNYRWYIDNYREWFQCVSTTGLFYAKAILFVQIPVLAYSTEGDFSKATNFLLNPELCGSIDALQLRSLPLSCETLVAPRRLHWMTLILKLHRCHSHKW